MKIAYEQKRFQRRTLELIETCDGILTDLHGRGFSVTLRTLYYQLVSRNLIPNTEESYNSLGKTMRNARRAGLIDWSHIVDQTRSLRGISHSDSPGDKIWLASHTYHRDRWEGQPFRPEVWVEKDALSGIISRPCVDLDVSFFACRGYTSESEMWSAAKRLQRRIDAGQTPVIFYMGDHDPSGLDMTRDVYERLSFFLRQPVDVRRLALNMDQVQKFALPPNPTKQTDCRAGSYIREHGHESWELDALNPDTIADLITEAVAELLDAELAAQVEQQETSERELLLLASRQWNDVASFLRAM